MENQLEELIPKFANSIITKANNNKIFTTILFFSLYTIYNHFRRRCHHHHLPVFTFKPNPLNNDTPDCAVCLYDFTAGDTFRKLPKCNHCFHVDCIDAWFKSHSTCPLCRTQVLHLPSRHRHGGVVLSHFLSFSWNFLGKMENYVNDELTAAFVENLRHFS
ncbi:RING-H2 finger protein ATL60 [Camellia lanceoleosa]|uniref:RING-H2 finger protein ATL60 n=1 Tax=Camellia lanceoleosa TaxID=1840588 RepID=A0ACC0IJA5_9ERIC|nr:RING-H2 finger protein ATL60 [Camellia lanceoleosa]